MLEDRRHFLALARAFVARTAPESWGKINPVGGVIQQTKLARPGAIMWFLATGYAPQDICFRA